MDYKKHYNLLCEKAKLRQNVDEYVEKHHIVPKCLGGDDDPKNIAVLSYREHFVAHWLLCKIYPNHTGINYAFLCMLRKNNKHERILTSRMVDTIKRNFADFKRWHISISNPGKTEVSRKKARERMLSAENPMKKTPEKNPFLGKSYVRGKVWYNNGVENRYLLPDDPIPEGYVRGMKPYIRPKRSKS